MSPPTWAVGQVLTASDVNQWLVPDFVVKPSAQHVTSSTALVNDTALVLPVAASAIYDFKLFLHYQGGTLGASDLKFSFTFPAGATAVFHMLGYSAGNVDQSSAGRALTDLPLTGQTGGAGSFRALTLIGSFSTAGTAGNLQLQWAQNTSSATDTIVDTGSYLRLDRMT